MATLYSPKKYISSQKLSTIHIQSTKIKALLLPAEILLEIIKFVDAIESAHLVCVSRAFASFFSPRLKFVQQVLAQIQQENRRLHQELVDLRAERIAFEALLNVRIAGLNNRVNELEAFVRRSNNRVVFTVQDLAVLEAAFLVNPRPTRQVKLQLSNNLNVPISKINGWFARRR